MKNSETIGKIAEALTKVQAEIKDVFKDRKGFNYYYADLASVLEVIRPLASKHGIAFVQMPISRYASGASMPDSVGIETILIHASGEYLGGKVYAPIEKVMKMSIAQSVGNVITYLRRYALSSFFGIAQTDNDARISHHDNEAPYSEVYTQLDRCSQYGIHHMDSIKVITKKNIDEIIRLKEECEIDDNIFQKWLGRFEVDCIENLSESQSKRIIDHLMNRIEKENDNG